MRKVTIKKSEWLRGDSEKSVLWDLYKNAGCGFRHTKILETGFLFTLEQYETYLMPFGIRGAL